MNDPLPTDKRRVFDAVWTSLVGLGVILAITVLRHGVITGTHQPAWPAPASLNPNTAPWWELMVLPDIGETSAHKIVDYRLAHADEMPVFNGPADLEPVPGIGPKTIQRIAPYLRFNE